MLTLCPITTSHSDTFLRLRLSGEEYANLCACREVSGREECTGEGEDHHWLHKGNDRVVELASKTRGMDMLDDAIEAVRREEEFILADNNGTAQGEYRQWMSEKVTNMYIQQAKSVGLSRIRETKE